VICEVDGIGQERPFSPSSPPGKNQITRGLPGHEQSGNERQRRRRRRRRD
jgi:hypothetical protein